jgi:hypothetical protein
MRKASVFLILMVVNSLISLAQESCLQKKQLPSAKSAARNIDYNLRSDTLDILHTEINLNITDFTNKIIVGNAVLQIAPKMNNVQSMDLDLLALNVDSVLLNNQTIQFSHNDTILHLHFPTPIGLTDTVAITTYYHGIPVTDAAGFGGFYFQAGYAFNLGVGFAADPHVYGRVWYPCFDNFVEKCTYSFNIETLPNHKAFCGGLLNDTTHLPNANIVWEWKLNQQIPSYIASVAINNYATVRDSYSGQLGPVPVELAALAGDTVGMKASFTNLENCFLAFENAFGPYRWDRVGFVLVPFNSGAMEHACNIAYPRAAAVAGSLAYEGNLMAHELSHHWFGDLVTCTTAEDMWLNEGWASFSGMYFFEAVYNENRYRDEVRSNHQSVVQFLHWQEGGFQPVAGVPHDLTYSGHVYNKGADVAHTLRAYLGDSLFFAGIKAWMNANQFGNGSTDDFKNFLSSFSGINLQPFFDNWVNSPGFSHFSIDSLNYSSGTARVYIRQKLKGAPVNFTNVPLELSFYDAAGDSTNRTVMFSGQSQFFDLNIPINPVFTALDVKQKISDAIIGNAQWLKTTGNKPFGINGLIFNVNQVTDSSLIYMEHHLVAPDTLAFSNPSLLISPNRYWSVGGIFKPGFLANATFSYDGRTTNYSGTNFLDNGFILGHEDSLVLLYRQGPGFNWITYPYQTKNIGNATDKAGSIKADSLMIGEYTFGRKVNPNAIDNLQKSNQKTLLIKPNPVKGQLAFELDKTDGGILALITDVHGKVIKDAFFPGLPQTNSQHFQMDVSNLNAGIYFLQIKSGSGILTEKFIVQQ